MAGLYNVNYVIELLFDVEFDLSGSEICGAEGEDTYYYRGEACLTKESVEDFGSRSVSSSSGFSLDKSEGNSERVTADTYFEEVYKQDSAVWKYKHYSKLEY